MRVTRKLGNERPRTLGNTALLHLFKSWGPMSLEVSRPQSGARGHVVNVLLDMAGDVILFGGNIESSSVVFPDPEIGEEKLLNFSGCCVKLNPLRSRY
jgi:hypothetical protein